MANIIRDAIIEKVVYNDMTASYIGYYTDSKGREYIHVMKKPAELEDFLANNKRKE